MCSYVFKPCSLFTLSKHCIYTGTVLLQSSRPRFPYFNKHKKVSDPARQEYEYFEKLAQELPIGLFSKWENACYIYCITKWSSLLNF